MNGWQHGEPIWGSGFLEYAPECPFATAAQTGGSANGNDLNAWYILVKPRGNDVPGRHGRITIRQLPVENGAACRYSDNQAGSRTAVVTGILAGSIRADCEQLAPLPPAGNVTYPDFARFRCKTLPGQIERFFIDDITTGWSWRVSALIQGNILESVKAGNGPDVFEGGNRPWNAIDTDWYVDLIPTQGADPDEPGQLWVRFSGNSGGTPLTAHLTINASPPETPVAAADFSLGCSPPSVSTLTFSTATVSCSFGGNASLGERRATLTEITVVAPSGWSIASTDPGAFLSGGILSIRPDAAIGYPTPGHSFTFTLTPSCATAGSLASIQVATTFSHDSTSSPGPSHALSLQRTEGTVDIDLLPDTSISWETTVRLATTTLNGVLAYRVSAEQCGGWNVQITAGPFVYAGPNGGEDIPASSFAIVGTGDPVPLVGAVDGLSTPGVGALDSPVKTLSANAGAGWGVYDHSLDVQVTIPANARAGDYVSTITIATASGP